jgi:carbon-monoxide dehydrogenase large subunit
MLDVRSDAIVDVRTGEVKLPLAELGRIAYFRPDTLPLDFQSELMVTRHYTPRGYGFAFTNGIQASLVEVDVDTGFVKLLKHWCVEDCGTIINPQLVDEQIRGGIVQGIGGALLEHCIYSPEGQLINGNMAEYLVPMAGEMPDMVIAHVVTPTKTSELGAKGAGEAGTAGAPGAVMNAINDALRPFKGACHCAAGDTRAHSAGAGQGLGCYSGITPSKYDASMIGLGRPRPANQRLKISTISPLA